MCTVCFHTKKNINTRWSTDRRQCSQLYVTAIFSLQVCARQNDDRIPAISQLQEQLVIRMACRWCRATTCAHHDSLSWPCWMVGCRQWPRGAQHPRSTSGKAIVTVVGVVQKSCEIHASGHDRSFFCDFSLDIMSSTARQHANGRSSRSCCTTVPTSFNPRR